MAIPTPPSYRRGTAKHAAHPSHPQPMRRLRALYGTRRFQRGENPLMRGQRRFQGPVTLTCRNFLAEPAAGEVNLMRSTPPSSPREAPLPVAVTHGTERSGDS